MSGARAIGSILVVAIMAVTTAACGEQDPFADYCDEVAAQQKPLSEALGAGGPTALIVALPSFRALREKSPSDLRDEWDTVVGRVQALVDALEEAGVDPETYSAQDPPEGLSTSEMAAIDAAAEQLVAAPTVRALEGVQQQARDVCKMPLSL